MRQCLARYFNWRCGPPITASYFRGALSLSVIDRPAGLMQRAFVVSNPDARAAQIEAAVAHAYMAPTLVALLFAPQPSAKIPLREQQMSVGAVGMNLLHAAHAHGFVASWITGWASYDTTVRAALCTGEEEIAGFFFIGTPSFPLEERPRPDPTSIVRNWP